MSDGPTWPWTYDRVGDPGGRGHQQADWLRSRAGEWLTSEPEDGVFVYKKNGHLEVEAVDTPVAAGLPIVWGMLPHTTGVLDYRLYGTAANRKTKDFAPVNVNPGFLASGEEIYVGGGYVLQLRYLPPDSGVVTDPCPCWPVLINSASGADEVLSLSPGNVAGANVSFYDAAILPGRKSYWDSNEALSFYGQTEKPSIFATGWDASVQGYSFGFVGRAALTDTGQANPDGTPYTSKTPWDMVVYVGNTATRTLTRIDIPGTTDGMLFSGLFRVMCVDHGKLMALVQPLKQVGADTSFFANLLSYPDPPAAWRSDDHGHTWYVESLPELQPHMFLGATTIHGVPQATSYFADFLAGLPFTSGIDTYAWRGCPIGSGRIAMLVLCNKEDGRVWLDTENPGIGSPYTYGTLPLHTCYRFFISDVGGHNFQVWSSPLDLLDGYESGSGTQPNFYQLPVGTWSNWGPAARVAQQSLQPSMTAGPGTFFVPIGRMQFNGDFTQAPRYWPHESAVVYTLDFGQTWTTSPTLDPAGFTFRGTQEPIAMVIVAKPYTSPTNPGVVYLLSVQLDGSIRILQTDATFTTTKVVYGPVVDADLYVLTAPSRISGVFVGQTGDANYPPRLYPGLPEFEKP